jgi:small conductance mechanosensitive channel
MDILSQLRHTLADDRFTANVLVAHSLLVVIVIGSLILRRLLTQGGSQLARWTGLGWMEDIGQEAARRGRTLLLWLTVGVVLAIIGGSLVYHVCGRDIRRDLGAWYGRLTPEELLRAGWVLGALAALALATWSAIRTVRRFRPLLEGYAAAWLGRADNEEALRRWFRLLERFSTVAASLAAVWAAGHVVSLGKVADDVVGFVLRVLTVLAGARLLTLASRALSRTAADLGDRHLGTGPFGLYWERIKRLFPFGERCFEAAVYVSAASLCVRELHFIAGMADFGPSLVRCIGIFFGTRVLIELLQVVLHQAFGLYDDRQPADQKGRTLVPLLHSVCQYVLYFGSGVLMLDQLGIDTRPLLAGAGILGLAVGLGAQSLVTDVVSGFFILFENQFLVGDLVKIGEACGTVEAVGIRLTQLRDEQGKLHLIPNGQIKGVITYSKGYVNAIVDVRVPSGSDLETVFGAMREAGRRLRRDCTDALTETEVQGLIEPGPSEMTLRAVTKVRPGTHLGMQNEYRRLLKQVFDENQGGNRPAVAA